MDPNPSSGDGLSLLEIQQSSVSCKFLFLLHFPEGVGAFKQRADTISTTTGYTTAAVRPIEIPMFPMGAHGDPMGGRVPSARKTDETPNTKCHLNNAFTPPLLVK